MIMPDMSNFSERTREIQEKFYRAKDEFSRVVPYFHLQDTFMASRIIGEMYPDVGYCEDQIVEASFRFLDFGRDLRLEKLAEYYPDFDRDVVEQVEPLYVIAAKSVVNGAIERWTSEIERLRKTADLAA